MRFSRLVLSCIFGAAVFMSTMASTPSVTNANSNNAEGSQYRPLPAADNGDVQTPQTDFSRWVNSNFRASALAAGVSPAVFDREAGSIRYLPRVVELDRKQPERKIGFDEYQSKTFTQSRIQQGRNFLDQYRSTLNEIGRRYGVQPEYVVALWGMETSYGKNTGGFDILSALVTLAYDGRRGAYFKDEAIKALKILQGNHITRSDFKGSWAGAMGQVQFMPTSWNNFAVDYDGDGHKDIWTTRVDAFASAANYLRSNGWVYGRPWGHQVSLPSGFNQNLIDRSVRKTSVQWAALGVRGVDGLSGSYYLVKPTGGNGKVFAGSENLGTIMKWNNSSYFAITVGELADAIAGRSNGAPASTARSNTAARTGNVISNRPDLVQPHYND